jgi:hypothetical protein
MHRLRPERQPSTGAIFRMSIARPSTSAGVVGAAFPKARRPHHGENLSNLPQKLPIRIHAQHSCRVGGPRNSIAIVDAIGFPD